MPQALALLRGGTIEDIESEANAIMGEAGELDSNDRLSVDALLKTRALYLPLFVVICMHLSQQVGFLKGSFLNESQPWERGVNNYVTTVNEPLNWKRDDGGRFKKLWRR